MLGLMRLQVGEHVVMPDLSHDSSSGNPDSLDRLVEIITSRYCRDDVRNESDEPDILRVVRGNSFTRNRYSWDARWFRYRI